MRFRFSRRAEADIEDIGDCIATWPATTRLAQLRLLRSCVLTVADCWLSPKRRRSVPRLEMMFGWQCTGGI